MSIIDKNDFRIHKLSVIWFNLQFYGRENQAHSSSCFIYDSQGLSSSSTHTNAQCTMCIS